MVLAAVLIVRRKEWIFGVLYAIFVSSMMVPAIASFVTLYVMMARLRLVNSTSAVSLLYGAQFMLPIGVLIFTRLPEDGSPGARGSGEDGGVRLFRAIFHVSAPLIRAPVLSLAVLQLPAVWKEFLIPIPLLFLRKQETKPLTLLIYNFTRDHESDFGAIFALIVLGMVVPLALFLFARKKIEESVGVTAGGVKG